MCTTTISCKPGSLTTYRIVAIALRIVSGSELGRHIVRREYLAILSRFQILCNREEVSDILDLWREFTLDCYAKEPAKKSKGLGCICYV